MMRKIALDLGDARIGIAISDPLGVIASGLDTYGRVSPKADIAYIANLIAEKEADTVVLGLPINMDGTEGERVQTTREFAESLRPHTSAKIVFQDERLTTVSAERMLKEHGMRHDKRREVVDKVAATLILQTYLDRGAGYPPPSR
jgi:putative Holliday junction resolvase